MHVNTNVRRSKRSDRVARWVITLGGVIVIASVVAILLLIVGVTLPLFRAPTAEIVFDGPLPAALSGEVLACGVSLETGQQRSLTAHMLTADGSFSFLDLSGDRKQPAVLDKLRIEPPGAKDAKIVFAERHGNFRYSLVWSDGGLSLVEVRATAHFDAQTRRSLRFSVESLSAHPGASGPRPIQAVLRQASDGSLRGAALLPKNGLVLLREEVTQQGGLFGGSQKALKREPVAERLPGRITALTMDAEGSTLSAGTDNGRLVRWQLDAAGRVHRHEIVPAFHDKRAITSLAMVLGDVSLAVGDARGGLTTWFEVRSEASVRLRQIHALRPHAAAVADIVPSGRNKSLVSLGRDGIVHLDHMTSERHLLQLRQGQGDKEPKIAFSERGNAVLVLGRDRTLTVWEFGDMYPEASWKTLFGKVHYEGYERPEYVWQTTGSAGFEPKMSLVPLIHGTFKATSYAMLFAVPLALLGAAYTSHFTTPPFRQVIKPVVEIMAALPSVVIGFLVALWLAPLMQQWIVAFFASLVFVPATFVVFMAFWQRLRRFDWARRAETGYEFLVLLPVLLAGVGLAAVAAPWLENALFGGSFPLWLNRSLDMRYDQRNSIIISVGLGFAVIPIIFSIAEDSLSTVPHNLTAASLALGASRWQTLWRVILPSASPGIFAGIMIGFGRAVGETMIVLMATGNTPIMDWNPFNGMRTLSANIAVEIPEAPVGQTLYRVLFLCAVILFVLTFILNTAAELVRQHLRKRYGRFQ